MEEEKKKVLVVDDEPDLRSYLKAILEDAGFEVETASDGEEALNMVRKSPPDIISLDLVMPKKTGNKFIYEMKKDKKLARIPVIIVTAHARDELGKNELEDLLKNGMISGPGTYLEKPVNAPNYVRSIRRALGMDENVGTANGNLRDELRDRIMSASPDALRKALEALEKSK